MDQKPKDSPQRDRTPILVVGPSPLSESIAKILVEQAKVFEAEQCQPLFDPPDDNRGAHIQKRIERKYYKQWEQNLRSKMRSRVR